MSQPTSDPHLIELAILGPLEMKRGSQRLDVGGSKQRTLLGALALEANRVVSDGELVNILWGDEPGEGAIDALRVHIHRLRRTFENCDGARADGRPLVRSLTGYSLVLKTNELDVSRFRALVNEARTAALQGGDAQALALFDSALALWRGPVLDDFGDAPFITTQRIRLDKLRVEALEDRFDVCLRLGLHRENVSAMEALAEEYPLRERLQAQLLLALYRCGRQAEASDAYQRTRRRLADELGMEPGPDLQATFREILRHEVAPPRSGGVDTPSPTSIATKGRTNLPAELSTFIGRRAQIAEVSELLASNRQVTLVGPGGIGKTRLAIQLGHRLLDAYHDGIWLVDLATVVEAETLPYEVLTWLGFREQPDSTPVASLVTILQQRHLLLVLDNCEHLVDATAELVQTLLRSCAHLSILATSRERLNCDGEQAWSVPSLDTPNPERNTPIELMIEHDAVMLFVERARRARRAFALTVDNARAVTQLCSRLDGIPLAIELAAARSAALSPEELLEHLGNRFRLVTGSRRASVSRHRTMQATIEWSHRLLTPEEQVTFRRLGVFSGSFDLAAAEAVCEDRDLPPDSVVGSLERLVDKSLVVYADVVAGEGRYRVLETVRQFAQEQLASDPGADRVRNRHATHYLNVGEHFEHQYREGRFSNMARQLETEYANARSALEWAESADAELFLSLAATWWHYWWLRGSLTEGRVWLARALASAGESLRARARVLCGMGRLTAIQGDSIEAERAFTEGMSLALRADDQVTVAVLHNSLGLVALWRGSDAEADVHFRLAVALWESLKVPVRAMAAHANLGESFFIRGEYDQARTQYEAAIRFGAEDDFAMATALMSLANLERHVGNYGAARERAAEGLRAAYRDEYATGLSSGLQAFAFLAAAEDQPFRAAVLAEGAAILTERWGAVPDRFPHSDEAEQCLTEACSRLDKETLTRARRFATAMTADEAVAYALGHGDSESAAGVPSHSNGEYRRDLQTSDLRC